MPRFALILEFLILFVALPLGYRFSPVRFPVLPLLWIAAAYAWERGNQGTREQGNEGTRAWA